MDRAISGFIAPLFSKKLLLDSNHDVNDRLITLGMVGLLSVDQQTPTEIQISFLFGTWLTSDYENKVFGEVRLASTSHLLACLSFFYVCS